MKEVSLVVFVDLGCRAQMDPDRILALFALFFLNGSFVV